MAHNPEAVGRISYFVQVTVYLGDNFNGGSVSFLVGPFDNTGQAQTWRDERAVAFAEARLDGHVWASVETEILLPISPQA